MSDQQKLSERMRNAIDAAGFYSFCEFLPAVHDIETQLAEAQAERLTIQRAIAKTQTGGDGSEDDDVKYRLDEITDHIAEMDRQRKEGLQRAQQAIRERDEARDRISDLVETCDLIAEITHPLGDKSGENLILSVKDLKAQGDALAKAMRELVDMYVANKGTKYEFITCITPPVSSQMSVEQRAKSKTWKAWDNAREALAALERPAPADGGK